MKRIRNKFILIVKIYLLLCKRVTPRSVLFKMKREKEHSAHTHHHDFFLFHLTVYL
jgi:hypothetical protein